MSQKKPYVVGISGGSCSGKSTIAGKLASALKDLNAVHVNMDAYFKPDADRPTVIAPYTGREYSEHNHPDAYDLVRFHNDLNTIFEAGEAKIVIVEGILAMWDETVRNLMDLKLFIDCKSDERLIRRIKRFMAWGEAMDQVTERFLDTVRWRHEEFVEPTRWYADFVLNGSTPSETAFSIVVETIRRALTSASPVAVTKE